jgi:hypothetical protein
MRHRANASKFCKPCPTKVSIFSIERRQMKQQPGDVLRFLLDSGVPFTNLSSFENYVLERKLVLIPGGIKRISILRLVSSGLRLTDAKLPEGRYSWAAE